MPNVAHLLAEGVLMRYEKVKQAIFEALINVKKFHNLSDAEIDGLAKLVGSICGFDRTLRNIFYNGIGKIDKDIKEELKRQEQVILSTVDKDKREELKEEAQEEANKILNKKGIIN